VDNDRDGEVVISARVHPDTDYEFQARGRAPRTGWSAWQSVHTANIRVRRKDLENGAAGGRKIKPHSMENIVPLWDIDDDVEPSASSDATFSVSGTGAGYTVISPGNMGRQAIRLTRTTGNTAAAETWPEDRAPIKGGSKFYLETMAKVSTGSAANGLVQIQARFYSGAGVLLDTQTLKPGGSHPTYTTAWQLFGDRVQSPSDARTVGLRAYLDGGATALSLDVDRITLNEANAENRIDDGKIGKRHAKKEDFTLQRRAFDNTATNTPPGGSKRRMIAVTVPCDPEFYADIDFMTVAYPYHVNKAGNVKDYSSKSWIHLYANGEKIREWRIRFGKDDYVEKTIAGNDTDSRKRTGNILYELWCYREPSGAGAEVDFRSKHIRVRIVKR